MLSPNTTEHFLFIFANKNFSVIAHLWLTRLQSLSPHVNHWVTESCDGAAADGDLNYFKSWPILQRYRRLWLVARVLNFYLRQSYLLVWFLVRPRRNLFRFWKEPHVLWIKSPLLRGNWSSLIKQPVFFIASLNHIISFHVRKLLYSWKTCPLGRLSQF